MDERGVDWILEWSRSLFWIRLGWFRFFSFDFQSDVLGFVFFFVFGIRRPPQCKNMLVCENTKTESINCDKKFQLSRLTGYTECEGVCFWWKVLHTWHGLSVGLSQHGAFSNGSTDWHAVWVEDSGWGQEIMCCCFQFQYSHITTTQEYPSVWKHRRSRYTSVESFRRSISTCHAECVWRSYSSHSMWSTPHWRDRSVDLAQLGRI